MKDASQYPVTFAYGATDGVYYGPNGSIGPYHRGDDRAMPMGTPVIVNGIEIGLSGNGNGRYGPHLHVGKFINSNDVNPNGQGFSLDGAVVYDVLTDYSADPINAKYVRIQDASGALWVYLHLSQVNVTKGQKIEGEDMEPIFNDGDRKNFNFWLYNEDRLLYVAAIGMKYKDAVGAIFTSKEYQDNLPPDKAQPLKPGIYEVK